MLNFKGREKVPSLEVPTVGGGTWRLVDSAPKNFTLVLFYRSLHCPICKRYLGELESKLAEFEELGVSAIAISVDTEERAAQAKSEWGLAKLTVGYGLSIPKAREWGLFISGRSQDSEPPQFTEPGLFMIKPDGTLFSCCVGNTPWARPPWDAVLTGTKRVVERGTPARGEA